IQPLQVLIPLSASSSWIAYKACLRQVRPIRICSGPWNGLRGRPITSEEQLLHLHAWLGLIPVVASRIDPVIAFAGSLSSGIHKRLPPSRSDCTSSICSVSSSQPSPGNSEPLVSKDQPSSQSFLVPPHAPMHSR